MSRSIEGVSREQTTLFPESLDEYIGEENPARFIDAFVGTGRKIEYYLAQGCQWCPLKSRCTRSQESRRITRHVDEAVLENMEKRVEAEPDKVRVRKALSEHPFGTLKAAMGYGTFLTRGLDSVRTEMSLAVLAYNLKRVLNIMGTRNLLEAMG